MPAKTPERTGRLGGHPYGLRTTCDPTTFVPSLQWSQVKFWEGGDPPPCFSIDGMNYIHVRKNGLLFAVSTPWNVSPSMFLELLNRLAKVFKDYCGVLSEVRVSKDTGSGGCRR